MLKRYNETALAPILRPVLPRLAAGAVAAVVSGLGMLAALWCIVQFIADLAISWILIASGLWLLSALMASFASWLSHHAEAEFTSRLRREVASHLLKLPASTLARQGSNALRHLVSEDIAALHHMTAHLPSEIASFAVVPLASILLLVTLVGPAALLALVPGILATLYYLVWMPRVSARHGAERMRVMNEITAAVDDYARGIRTNRIYGAQSGALAVYRDATYRFTRGMVDWVGKVAPAAALAVALLQAAATFAIAYAVAAGHDASTLAAALLFSLAIVTPALRLGHGLDYVATGRAAAGRLVALLRTQELPAGSARLPQGAAVVDVKDVAVTAENRRVLDALSYRFMPGTLTAITGPSGTGKTTLLRAVAGLEPLNAGVIFLAGINIATLDAHTRQRACLFIPQGGPVLPGTVRQNLALSAPEASDDQMTEALLRAQIDISLQADVAQLSGGERQRVGLARAFLVAAPVILLDEPTSALDEATATRLVLALSELARDLSLTIIMVTHDQALAEHADARLELKPNMQPEVLS